MAIYIFVRVTNCRVVLKRKNVFCFWRICDPGYRDYLKWRQRLSLSVMYFLSGIITVSASDSPLLTIFLEAAKQLLPSHTSMFSIVKLLEPTLCPLYIRLWEDITENSHVRKENQFLRSDLRTTYLKDPCCTEFLCVIRNVSVYIGLVVSSKNLSGVSSTCLTCPWAKEDYFPSVRRGGCVTAQCHTEEKLMQEVFMRSQDM